MSMFAPATKKQLKARITLDGPAGSGKTYTALRFAMALAQGGRVAVIDTEHRSASKYVGESPDGFPWEFSVCEMEHYAPSTYTQVVRSAGLEGFAVIVVDSLSHAWEGVGGALDQVDKKKDGGNSFTAWKDVTPQHREMVETLLSCPAHLIVTMRTKMEYVLEERENARGRKVMAPKKVGMQPIQRAGMEYEFDVVCDLDVDHVLTVSKTRCSAIDGAKATKPGPGFVDPVLAWLSTGEVAVPATQPAFAQPTGVALTGVTDPHSVKVDTDACGDVIADKIKAAAQQAQVPIETIKQIMANFGVQRLAQLRLEDAYELLGKLERRSTDKQAPF